MGNIHNPKEPDICYTSRFNAAGRQVGNLGSRAGVEQCIKEWRQAFITDQLLETPRERADYIRTQNNEIAISYLNESDELEKKVKRKIAIIYRYGMAGKLKLALSNIDHYLMGSGETRFFDRDEMRKFKIIREKEEKLKNDILNGLVKNCLSIQSTTSFSNQSNASINTKEALSEGPDFMNAFGDCSMKSYAHFKLKNQNQDTVKVTGTFNFIFWDMIDFRDPLKSVPIIGSDGYMFYAELYGVHGPNGQLQMAKQFLATSEWSVAFEGEYKFSESFFDGAKWISKKWSDVGKHDSNVTIRSSEESSYRGYLRLMGEGFVDFIKLTEKVYFGR